MTSASARLLVVDDDAVSRLVLARILSRLGHEVDLATDVASGVAAAAATSPDLVFADFRMPDGTGEDLLVALRRLALTMPVVYVTGVAEREHPHDAVGLLPASHPVAAATLSKPVDSRAVSACVASILESLPVR